MKKMTIKVEGDRLPTTVKDYLRSIGLSVTFIKKVKMGGLRLHGETVTVKATVTAGDLLEISIPEEKSEGIKPIKLDLNILYEDDYILAVDKPTRMPTHPSKGNCLPTLAEAVMGMYDGDFVFRAVSRLDRDTSGIVVIAKDQITASALADQIKNRKFEKRYICITEDIPTPSKGRIEAPIRRESEESIKRIVAEDGKYALTEYEVLKEKNGRALCDIRLHTGRTHQIRVHMAHIGCPLFGDFLYGTEDEKGYYLRCAEVRFMHPVTHEILTIKATTEPIL